MSIVNFEIKNKGPYSQLVHQRNIYSSSTLLDYLRTLPYGRSEDRSDLLDVLVSERGTCSSKHAFFKSVAIENDQSEVELILCMYRMQVLNTPGIGLDMEQAGLSYIPEAHCYLKCKDERIDITNINASLHRIKNDILMEVPIEPQQVVEYKVDFHKKYVDQWIEENNVGRSFDEVWAVREKCIHNLSQ